MNSWFLKFKHHIMTACRSNILFVRNICILQYQKLHQIATSDTRMQTQAFPASYVFTFDNIERVMQITACACNEQSRFHEPC